MRTRQELVMAEVNAGFIEIINGKRKYKRFKISLEERIHPDNFGYLKENYKFNKYLLESYSNRTKKSSLQLKMNRLENHVIQVYHYFLANLEQPSSEEFKQELLTRMGRTLRYKEIQTFPTLKEAIAKVIDDEEKILRSAKGKNQQSTIRTYNTLLHYLERYEYVTGKPLEFNHFDKTAYLHFWKIQNDIVKGILKCEIEGQRKVATTTYGMLSSSVNKYQNIMKTLIKRTGYSLPLDFDEKGLMAQKSSNRKDLYLTKDEIEKIIKFKSTDPKLKVAQDYVILACTMGMRYESMDEAQGKSFEANESNSGSFYYIHSKQNKTNTEAYIPLFKPALDILKKHDNTFPKFPVNSKMNKYVKDLLQQIGIDRKEKVTYIPYLDKPFIEEHPIYELISTHDFRKTFYTNLSILEVSEGTIDLVTHPSKSSSKMSRVYDKSTLLDRARKFYNEARIRCEKQSIFYFE
jgi:integrase